MQPKTYDDFTLESSVYGVFRTASLQFLLHPLELVKVRQQSSETSVKAYAVAKDIFYTQGIKGFYNGWNVKLFQMCVKQIWNWPLIIYSPAYFEKYHPNQYVQHVYTSLTIATIDAALTTPLEKLKVQLMLEKKKGENHKTRDFRWIFGSWSGFYANWSRLSVGWTAFLVSQRFWRMRAEGDEPGRKLSSVELVLIGTKVAFTVSILSAPFDVYNTKIQADVAAGSVKITDNDSKIKPFTLRVEKIFRGLPLSTVSLIVQNIFSVFLIDYLSKKE